MIVAGIASIPERENGLYRAVQSLSPQVDKIYICLNGYNGIPKWQNQFKNVHFLETLKDYGDTGKFLMADQVDGYYLSCDDDIIYNEPYVKFMVEKCSKYGCPVSLHGRVYPAFPHSWRVGLEYHRCLDYVHADKVVDVVGTGVLCFHTSMIKVTMDMFPEKNMSDLFFALETHKIKLPIMVLSHAKGCIGHINYQNTLWKDKSSDKYKTEVVRQILSLK